MGGGGSQSVRQSIDIKSTTSILEKNIQKNSQKVQAAATANNSIEASVGINPMTGEMGNIIGCNMNFKQTATADAQSSATSAIESIAESKRQLKTFLKRKTFKALLVMQSRLILQRFKLVIWIVRSVVNSILNRTHRLKLQLQPLWVM